MQKESNNKNIVAAITDHHIDKYKLFEKVLKASLFFEELDIHLKTSEKKKADFRIVIKPNISMMLRRADVGTYTDSFLVIHFIRLLLQKGYSNVTVVESQNLYGNWFQNRSAVQIAARAGYFDESVMTSYNGEKCHDIHVKGGGVDAAIPFIDLSLDMVDYEFSEGRAQLGKTWLDADFRISFASMKTHFYSYYTLAIKNIYGCLPLQDKVRGYHCNKLVGPLTARLIRDFPVHFSIVDGYHTADGWVGVKMKAIFTKTHTIMAGKGIMAVDHFGASLMGLLAEKSIMYTSLKKMTPLRPYQVVGNAVPFKKWRNTPFFLPLFSKLIEAKAWLMDYSGSLATGGNDPHFPLKKSSDGILGKALFYLSLPISFFCDIGIVKLDIRKKYVTRCLKKSKSDLQLTLKKDIITNLFFLCQKDLDTLIELTESGIEGEVTFSGHYLFFDGKEFAFPSRFNSSAIAVVDILNHVRNSKEKMKQLATELKQIRSLSPLFDKDQPYSFCFK